MEDTKKKLLAERYRSLKEQRGVSDRQVSAVTGIAPSSLSDWATGKTVPAIDKLVEIAKYFEISVDELLDGVFDE
jgi:transcriptional regulator with XRE-family HTH domain